MFAFGTLIFWLGLLPVSNFIPLYVPMADLFLYLPLMGVAVMLASLPSRFDGVLVTVLAIVITGFGFITFEREAVWHDGLALWIDTVRKNPESYVAADNLCESLFLAGKPEAALPVCQRAIELSNAKMGDPFATMAMALDALGRTELADLAYRKAVATEAIYADPEKLRRTLVINDREEKELEVIATRNAAPAH